MKQFVFPVVLALVASFGFIGCGGGGDDGGLAEQQTELNCKQDRIDRIEVLQHKKEGGLSTAEQTELDGLYKQLEAEAEDPNLTCQGTLGNDGANPDGGGE